ncbi:MAG: 4-(cytidine 5'-diphospho)-2-C-methyl-D-erythritol kinase [Clostridia bacterium]|nr:4-(cytidine 5'-diphospho)-2-C-methyl-D-erythritol kinase [Clostridia bacterium]
MILEAHGKINLSLDITGIRENGYHEVEMVMQSVALCDFVSIEKNNSGKISVSSDKPQIPTGRKNIAYKACELMKSTYNLDCGFDIFIEKHIPMAGGMAGGSTDAAAVIRGINELCELGLTQDKLMELGLKIGADVPFCIHQKPALAKGLGEELTKVCGLSEDVYILLVNPNKEISTKKVYELFDEKGDFNQVDNESLVLALYSGDAHKASKYMKNVLSPISSSICPEICDINEKLLSMGAFFSMMSGSGATCFGLFYDMPDLDLAHKIFGNYYVSLTKPVNFNN